MTPKERAQYDSQTEAALQRATNPSGPGSFGAPAHSVVYSEQRSSSGEHGSMNRALLIALAILLMTMGCSQVNSPAEHQQRREGLESAQKEANKPQSPTELAKYHVTKKKTCQIASQTTACYSVSTDATLEEDLTAFTQHFRKQSSGVDNVVVTFFFDEPQAKSSSRGFTFHIFFDEPEANTNGRGFAFNSKEAARKILSRSLPQERSLQDAYLNRRSE